MIRKALDSPLGAYNGTVEVVSHEGGLALSALNLVHDKTGAVIRSKARFVPRNLYTFTSNGRPLGWTGPAKLVRESPRVSAVYGEKAVVASPSTLNGNGSAAAANAATVESWSQSGIEARKRVQRVGMAIYAAASAAHNETVQTCRRVGDGLYAAALAQAADEKSRAAWGARIAKAIADAAALVPVNPLDNLLTWLRARDHRGNSLNVGLVGPAGCGKSAIAQLAADRLGVPFYCDSFNRETPPYQLTGRREPLADGTFGYIPSQFVTAYENGGLYCADEFDAADANSVLTLNMALANGHMMVAERVGNERAVRHPNFYMVATLNTYGSGSRVYCGREELDEATIDRFQFVGVDYDVEYEATICESYRDRLADAEIAEVVDFRDAIRKAINSGSLRRVWSTRRLDAWLAARSAGISLSTLAREYFAAWSIADRQAAASQGVAFAAVPGATTAARTTY
jgi:MoxR-like ATPase